MFEDRIDFIYDCTWPIHLLLNSRGHLSKLLVKQSILFHIKYSLSSILVSSFSSIITIPSSISFRSNLSNRCKSREYPNNLGSSSYAAVRFISPFPRMSTSSEMRRQNNLIRPLLRISLETTQTRSCDPSKSWLNINWPSLIVPQVPMLSSFS